MKHFAKVNISLEEEILKNHEISQRIHGTISGDGYGIMEVIAFLIIDQAEKRKQTEGTVLAELMMHITKNKMAKECGAIHGQRVDLTELHKALDKLKEDGGPEDD